MAHGFACPRALSHKVSWQNRVVDPRGLERAVAFLLPDAAARVSKFDRNGFAS